MAMTRILDDDGDAAGTAVPPDPSAAGAARGDPQAGFARHLEAGTPQVFEEMTVVPLSFPGDRGPDYRTLAAGSRAARCA